MTREKHVYTNREIPHLWAHQTQGDARNGNGTLYFQGKTIYSYGSHFAIAQIIDRRGKGRGVLFNSRSYSVTTSQHQAATRRSIPGDWQVFEVPHVGHFGLSRKEDRYQHRQNVLHFKLAIEEHLIKCSTSRSASNKEWRHNRAVELREHVFAYCEFFGLRKPSIKPIPDLDSAQMEELRAREVSRAAKASAKRRAEEAERLKKAGSLADLWRQGGPGHYLLNVLPTMLRLVGHEIETSLGAKFSILHAKRGLALVRSVMKSGQNWEANGRTCKLGPYQISRISAEGTVTAGCHTVTWPEIERVQEQIDGYQPTVKCDECQMLSINGLPCHETGCPNSRRIWDEDEQSWVAVQENEDDLHA
jgi:hypothetical protein